MSARTHCAFEAFVIDQHSAQMKAAGHQFTEAMRQHLVKTLEHGRPYYSFIEGGEQWPAFEAAWKLSREALVITLPARAKPIDYQGRAIFSMGGEGRNAAIDEVRVIIESEGVTVV
ncbi:hypothetical protein [Pseudomonas sp. UMAB-40]|uniref:hypothetical protein n=1 Tax=Pseudomonas sp. UMAB-40 TaxID=1365407 RepID=UPI001C570A06|nr:hypothetical protein [Pseudomonas sp. UMAB-40]